VGMVEKIFFYHSKILTFINTNKNYPYAAAIKPIVWDISFKWLIVMSQSEIWCRLLKYLNCTVVSHPFLCTHPISY